MSRAEIEARAFHEIPSPESSCVALMGRALSEQDFVNLFRCLYEQSLAGGREGLAAAALLLKYKFGSHPERLDLKSDASPLVISSLVVREWEADE